MGGSLPRGNARVRPVDGVDVGAAQSNHRGGCDPLPAGEQARKGRILDEVCANTGWHRNHARKAFKAALQPKSIQEPQPTQEGQEAGVVSLRLTSDYERLLYVVLPAFHLMTDVLKLFDQLSKTPT